MTKKIEVLKKAIVELQEDFNYNWGKSTSCNCGLVAKVSMNLDFEYFADLWSKELYKTEIVAGSWTRSAQNCKDTGIPLSRIFQSLFETGFTKEEIMELEFLSNKEILKRAKIVDSIGHYSNKKNLINYLQTWIQLLEEQSIPKPEVKTVVKYVSVDAEVKELIPCLN